MGLQLAECLVEIVFSGTPPINRFKHHRKKERTKKKERKKEKKKKKTP